MRTLTSTLLAAQQSASAQPFLHVRLYDRDVGVPRLRWTRWYTGTEAAGPCVAAVPADGSLVRGRIDASNGALYHSRVASPGAGSTYGAWTSLGTVAVAPRLGLAAAGTRALIASVAANGVDVQVRESTDSGATFGSASVLVTASGTVTAVACTLQASGTAAVFYAMAGVVYVTKRTGTGSWSAPAAWSLSLASVSGLAATFDLDHQVLVSGATSTGATGVWSAIYGAGGAAPPGVWMPLVEVAAASSGTYITYLATALALAGVPRAAFVEAYSGAGGGGGGAYARVHLASGLADLVFSDQQWRDGQAFDYASAQGAGMAADATHAWLVAHAGVWHASIDTSATELTADVLEADVQQSRPGGFDAAGRARLVLRNDDGRYGVASGPLALAPGGELRIDPGYVSTAGAEASEGIRFWITSVRRRLAKGVAVVEVEATDGWGLLETWTAPRQLVWPAGATHASGVLAHIARHGGLRLVASGASTESTTWQPAFTVRAGERGATAFRRLLDALPDIAVMRALGPTLTEPTNGQSTTYAYGEGHAIFEARIDEGAAAPGWARVFGNGVFAETVDAAALRAGAGTAVVVDDTLVAQARADARATTVLRKGALEVERGSLVVPPNAGQEVGDVIEVTSPPLGLDSARYRVVALRLRLARGGPKPVYEMTVWLGAV